MRDQYIMTQALRGDVSYIRSGTLMLGILWRHYDTIEVSKRETLVLLTLTATLAPPKACYASNPNPS